MAETSALPSLSSYRLSTQDATFIYGESQSGPLHIGSIGLFEGRLDFNALLDHFDARMHLVPRYRQRLIQVPLNLAHAMMEDDPEYSLDNHMHLHQLPDAISEAEAVAEMMRVYQKPLDFKHPLWELHTFQNLEGNRSALLWKVHHSLVDGVSGMELLNVMYDFRAEPADIPQPPEPWVAARPSSLIRRFAEAVRDQIQSTVSSTINAAVEAVEDPASVAERARQLGEASLELLGHLGGEFRRRCVADHLANPRRAVLVAEQVVQHRLAAHLAAAALLAVLALVQVDGLARGDDDQQRPQVIAIIQFREAALFCPTAEAVEGAQRRVFLVGGAARQALELLARQVDEAGKVALPESLRRVAVTAAELLDPVRHRFRGRHGSSSGGSGRG